MKRISLNDPAKCGVVFLVDMVYNGVLTHSNVQHARRRALMTLAGVIVGVLIFQRVGVAPVVLFSVACACVGLSFVSQLGKFRSVLFIVGVVMIAGGWLGLRTRYVSIHRLDRVVAGHRAIGAENDTNNVLHERIPIELIGVVLDPVRESVADVQPGDPSTWNTPSGRTRVRVEQVYLADAQQRGTWLAASGRLRVTIVDGYAETTVQPGDRVKLIGMYRGLGTRRNIGEPDWAAISAQSGRVGALVIPDGALIEPMGATDFFGRVQRGLIHVRSLIRGRAMRAIGLDAQDGRAASSERAMLGALLLGQREPAFGSVYEAFKRVGVAHVFAISGFHLALVILIGAFAVRVIGEHPRAELVIILAVLALGMLVIPLRPPVVRAGVIVVFIILAGKSGRRYDRLTVLAWVGVGLLVWRPMDVFSLGYQLSMGISALLVMLADPQSNKPQEKDENDQPIVIAKQFPARGVIGKSKRWIFEALKMNFACWAVALPTIVYHAGIVSVFAPLVAVVLIPLVMVMMVVGYGQIAVGVLSPELGHATIGLLDVLADVVLGFVGWIDGLPGSSVHVHAQSGMMGVIWVVLSTGLLGGLVTGRLKIKARWVQGLGAALVVWFFVLPMVLIERAMLRIDMLDVGDGTCMIVQSDGEAIIWDCGSLNWRVGSMAGKAVRELGVSSIEGAVVTHDNLDHFNGLIDLAWQVDLDRVWITRRLIDDPSWAWTQTRLELEAMGIEIAEMNIGTKIEVGDATLTCLWPDRDAIDGLGDNDTSVVMAASVFVDDEPYVRTVLLTGDIESAAIERVISLNPELRVDVMEVPHHGSAKAESMDLVTLLNPKVVLQSTGASRLNDARWDSIREGHTWYTTADRGGIWVRILRDGTIEHGWAVDD